MATQKTHKLYLVRHAIAAERGDAWPDDNKRPLTPKGTARMRQVVRGLRELGVVVDVVLSSPLVRAKQTAELLVDGLKPAPTIVVVAVLAPGTAPVTDCRGAGAFRKVRRVALVGHEPGIGELATWLVGSKTPMPFKKGGICRIDVASLPPASGGGQLIWFAPPRMLRR